MKFSKNIYRKNLDYIPPNKNQWIENIGENVLVFAALVSPPWRDEDDVRI